MSRALLKLLALLYLPLSVVLVLGGVYTYEGEKAREMGRIETQEATEVALAFSTIQGTLELLRNDLRLLADSPSLKSALRDAAGQHDSAAIAFFEVLARTRPDYQQLRWIDAAGQERIRVDNDPLQGPMVVPPEKLQNKADRYYFRDSHSLPRGEIYVSRFDLNIEQGMVEVPHRPMLRVATPAFTATGERAGIVIINFAGARLLQDYQRQFAGSDPGHAQLLDGEGYWLLGGGPARDWAFMFGHDDLYARHFARDWEQLRQGGHGQFLGERGLTTFRRILLDDGLEHAPADAVDPVRNLYILSVVSQEDMTASFANARVKIWGSVVLLLLIGLAGCAALARAWVRGSQADQMLQINRDRSLLLSRLGEGVIGLDADLHCRVANPVAGTLLGESEDRLVGKAFQDLFRWTTADGETVESATITATEVREALARDGEFERIGWLMTARGEGSFPARVAVSAAAGAANASGRQSIAAVLVIQDLTDIKRAEAEVYGMAYFDALTGLPNRRMLLDRLDMALSSIARSADCGGLLYIDIDQFKLVNEVFGRSAGDQLLIAAAASLRAGLRAEDTVAHLGADHFVVLLPGLADNLESALAECELVASKLRTRLGRDLAVLIQPHDVSVSIGATLMADDRLDANALIEQAELAMSQAKAAGRNGIRFFDPAVQTRIESRVRLEGEIRDGLLRDEFVPYYQPKVNAAGRMVSVEALVRWEHPELGLVSPAEFIPVAEESGLILVLGQKMLAAACAQLVSWSQDPSTANLSIAVNVSARQFRNPNFVEEVLALLADTGAPAGNLIIELTESMLAEDIDQVIAAMQALRGRGIRFSLDDFGTGYSSLSYLKRLPLSQVKIDKSFVSDMLTNSSSALLVRTIIGIGYSLGLTTVAEGIETESQWDALREAGCEQGQGYLFGKPMPIATLSHHPLLVCGVRDRVQGGAV